MNLLINIYNGRGYLYSCIIFAIIYMLLRGYHQPEFIAVGIAFGLIIGLIMAPFHKTLDREGPKAEAFMSDPKNYIRPGIVAAILTATGFALYHFA